MAGLARIGGVDMGGILAGSGGAIVATGASTVSTAMIKYCTVP